MGKKKVRELNSFNFPTKSEFDEKITFCILTRYEAYRKDRFLVKKEFFIFLVVEMLSARRGTNCSKLKLSIMRWANMKKFKELFLEHFIIIIIPINKSRSIRSYLTMDDETFIFYRVCLNLSCYISKKVQKNSLMGLKIW